MKDHFIEHSQLLRLESALCEKTAAQVRLKNICGMYALSPHGWATEL